MVTSLKGVQLFLKMGQNIPTPVGYDIMTALQRIEVNDTEEERGDGFQLQFTVGRSSSKDYTLTQKSLFNPDTQVVIGVLLNTRSSVLISGVITHRQLVSGNQPGTSTFTITGKSITYQLNREERNDQHMRLADSDIVRKLVARYAKYRMTVRIKEETDRPTETRRIPQQPYTDFTYIQMLAEKHGYVFYSQPRSFGGCDLYWGPEDRTGVGLSALTMNMGAATNVFDLSFSYDPDRAVKARGTFLDLDSLQSRAVSSSGDDETLLAQDPNQPRNTVLLRSSARYTFSQAKLAARTMTVPGRSALTGSGTLDTVRYGQILEAGKVIEVRGAGSLYDGKYVVTYVKHTLQRGKYTQSFELAREGLGSNELKVTRQ
jgi:phage protein D